jgi:hypothetical protein
VSALEAYRRLRARSDDLRETWQRCRELLVEPGASVRTDARARALASAIELDGVVRDPVETPVGRLWNAAWAGWCWREVDTSLGDPDPAVRLAYDRARRRRDDAAAAGVGAAAELAQSSWSPGAGDHVERVTSGVLSMLGGDGSDHLQLRLAFRYGLAVHDVERLLGSA